MSSGDTETSGPPVRVKSRNHFWDFLKNLGLAGGLLMVVFGTRLAPLNDVLADPLSSTPVYSAGPAASAGQTASIVGASKRRS